jgi:hypothetical protein
MFFVIGGLMEMFTVAQQIRNKKAYTRGLEMSEQFCTDRMKSAAMTGAGILLMLQTAFPAKATALNDTLISSGTYVQQGALNLWLVAAGLAFVISLALPLLQNGSSMISVLLNMFSALTVLYSGYLYTNGQLISNPFSALNSTDGSVVVQSNVILDGSTSMILFILGFVMFVVFLLQAIDFYESTEDNDDNDEQLGTFS